MERFRERPIGLVITDMVMPEKDGIELIRTLVVERPSLPIIAISGVHDGAHYLAMAVARRSVESLARLAAPPSRPAALRCGCRDLHTRTKRLRSPSTVTESTLVSVESEADTTRACLMPSTPVNTFSTIHSDPGRPNRPG